MSPSPSTTSSALKKSTPDPEHRRLVLAAVGALGVSCVMTQLALMRELLGVLAGNEMVLGVVLGLWLLLMGLGAPLTLWMGMLLALATAGVGLILPLIGWGIVAIDAFYEDDRRKVHPLL